MSTELKQIEKVAQKKKEKKQIEGFGNVMTKQMAIEKMSDATKNINLDLLKKMTNKYDTLAVEYNTTLNNLKTTTMDNINRTTNNPYLNKNIRFSNDVICYVTKEGVAKPYQSYQAFMQSSEKNGCPSATYIDVNMAWQSSFVEGSVIPLTPTLVVGKPMEIGQSCGNEGINIYASKMVSKPTSKYNGCYNDKSVQNSAHKYATYEECEKFASDNNYKYFGLLDMRSDGKSMCKVYNNPNDFQQYGSVGAQLIPFTLWSSGTETGSPQNIFQLLATGQMIIKNSNSNILFSTAPSAACIDSGLIKVQSATYGGNCKGRRATYNVDTNNVLSKVKQLCDGKERCKFPASNAILGGDPARGCYKSFNMAYKCGNNNAMGIPPTWEGGMVDLTCARVDRSECNFFLKLENNGKMAVLRGKTIDAIKEEIWTFQPQTNKALTPNPEWVSTKGKTGVNYLSQGQILAAGEWIGSTNGSVRLIMETNGNLILETSESKASCGIINEKYYGLSPQTNAVYELEQNGNPSNLGKLAYVTADGMINEYDDSMLGYYNEYNVLQDYDSYGNTLKQIDNVSRDECISQCNADGNCAGFVYQSDGSKCFLKNGNTYPRAAKQPVNGLTLGIRKKKVLPGTCNQETVEVDTIQYSNYAKGKLIRTSQDCNLNIVSQKYKVQFDSLKNQLAILGEEISTKMEEMYSKNNKIYEDMGISETEFKENIKKYRGNTNRIRNELAVPVKFEYPNGMNVEGMTNMNTLNSMLSDADIRLLEENYGYIFWSILAIGVISTTINIV